MAEIAILLSTYNGSKYIECQLDSLLNQTAKNWKLCIRDDGSTDGTKKILEKYVSKFSQLHFFGDDENLGAAKSFMKLLKDVESDYYMFCDQDDLWLEDKIKYAFSCIRDLEIENVDSSILVFSDAQIVDSELKMMSESFIENSGIVTDFVQEKGYVNITNISPGCTYIFNRKLRDEVLDYPLNLPMHDWWLVLRAKELGKLYFLNRTDMLYRQHENNVIGAHQINLRYYLMKFVKINNTIRNQYQQYQFLKSQHFINTIFEYYFLKLKFLIKNRTR